MAGIVTYTDFGTYYTTGVSGIKVEAYILGVSVGLTSTTGSSLTFSFFSGITGVVYVLGISADLTSIIGSIFSGTTYYSFTSSIFGTYSNGFSLIGGVKTVG